MSVTEASHIQHADILSFADERVNLKRERVKKYRDQVQNVRDHIERYIKENPDTGLVKTLLSGSLAKGTALRSLNDVDVALYIKADTAPTEQGKLLEWLRQELMRTYPQKDSSDIYIDGPCVVIAFTGTGLNVDIAPVYYDGDEQDRGFLWDRFTGEKVLTSIPLHLQFIRKRKGEHNSHYAQVIRLLKWWVKQREATDSSFKLRSFLIELIVAHLADDGMAFSDYVEALKSFFLYVTKSELSDRIAFTDYYSVSQIPEPTNRPIEIFDPVNPKNNVAGDYTTRDRDAIVVAAEEALEALIYAQRATTKGETVECWQDVLGTSFN